MNLQALEMVRRGRSASNRRALLAGEKRFVDRPRAGGARNGARTWAAKLPRALLLGALLTLTSVAWAAGVNWGDLSPSQQALLKNQQTEWANLSTERQEILARGAERWLALTPDKQTQARTRLERYQQMTPAQRQDVLAKREQFRALAPERQRKLHERHEQFKKLPVEEQKQIREAYGQSRRQTLEQNRQLRDCLNREVNGEAVDCSRYTAPEKSPRNMDPNKDAPGVRLPKL